MTAKSALLQALASGGGYGLELIERIRERTGGLVSLHEGSVYPALRSMERGGLVERYEVEGPPKGGGRPRRYYRITAAGRRAAETHRKAVRSLFSV